MQIGSRNRDGTKYDLSHYRLLLYWKKRNVDKIKLTVLAYMRANTYFIHIGSSGLSPKPNPEKN